MNFKAVCGGGDNEGSSVVLGTMGKVRGGRREYGTAGWEAGTRQDECERKKQAGQEYTECGRGGGKLTKGLDK
jgi:hypothetical protein